MQRYNPSQAYDSQDLRYGATDAGDHRGKWTQYMSGDGSKAAAAMGNLNTASIAPSSGNEQMLSALEEQAEAMPLQQWQQGFGRNLQSMATAQEIGYGGLNGRQQVQQAKEMARLAAQSANQGGLFSMIGSGLGALGSIGGLFRGGGGGSGSLYQMPGAGSSRFGLW